MNSTSPALTGDTPAVLVTRHEGWAELVLNRPDQRNALNDVMTAQLMARLDDLAAPDGPRAILLTGAGRAFCAGQDLSERDPRKRQGPPDLQASVENRYNPLIRRLRAMPQPVVCAVNGVAAGAGLGIALACDITLAAAEAHFVLAFARIGLVPDAGTSWQLVRRLGEARAMALTLTGGSLIGAEAAACGLIWQAHPSEELLTEARALTRSLATGPTFGLGLARQAIRAAAAQGLEAQLELEARLQGAAGRSPDYDEGALAFLEKRPARFTGRGER